jgi:hypothetical protein
VKVAEVVVALADADDAAPLPEVAEVFKPAADVVDAAADVAAPDAGGIVAGGA